MIRALRTAVVSVSLVALAACGGSDSPAASGSASGSASDAGSDATSAAPGGGDVVEIKGTEQLKFEPATLTAKVGVAFNGRLVQVGSIPHNIAIEEFGVQPDDTYVRKAGEAKSFSFTPDKPGSFEYVCTIHPATMKGTLTVT